MSTATLNEYLNTSYEPDMEFVDGVTVHNLPRRHSYDILHCVCHVASWRRKGP